jgi:hypothetical protein
MNPAASRLVLCRAHTHAGRHFAPGDRIVVDAATAQWLLEQGIAAHEARPTRTEVRNDSGTAVRPQPRTEFDPSSPQRKEPKS